MPKYNKTLTQDSVKYKQTDLNFYFKVKNKHIMKFKSYRTNKENGASNSVVKQQKSSRDEVALINSKSILQELPFELPHYCSEEDIDTDSAFCSDSHTTSVLASTINGKTNPSRQDIQSVMSTTSSSVEEMKIKLEPVVISSDEDFEPTPRKKTKRMSTKTTLSEEETIVRVKSYLQQKEKEETQNKTKGKVNRKLYTLQTTKKCKPMVKETAGFKLRVRKDLLAQKSSSVLKISTISIGVHRPTTIVTSPQKSKPYILEKKNSNTELRLPTSEIAEASCSTSNSFLKNCSVSPITRTTSTPIGSPNTPPKNPITLDKSPNTPRKSPSITPKKNLRNLPKKTPRRRGSVQVKSENDGTVEDEWSPLALRLIRKIMQYISSHDHLKTLLSEQEMQMLNRFCQMPKDEYMFFCIKLYTRIQKWYNIFKLSALVKLTMSDPEVRVMYMYLSENGFVDTDYSSESCGSLLNHLLQKEIKDICESFRLKLSTSKKPDMIQKLLENCNRQSTLTFAKSTEQILKERIKDKMGFCVKLNPGFLSLLKKLHVLYAFTTSDFQSVNDLYLFMIRILTGEIVMPEIPVDTNFKVFPSVTEFSIFAEAYECKRALLEAIDKKEVEHMRELCILAYSELKTLLQHPQPERPAYLNRFTAGSKYTTALSVGTKNLAKHHPNEVQEWLIFLLNQNQYGQQLRGLWYDSLIMVQYFYLKQYNDATETLINALSSTDLSEVAIYDLSYRAEAIKRSKAHKVTTLQYDRICFVQPTPLHDFPAIEINARAIHDNESGKKRQYLERTENGQNVFNVEQVALNHYLQNGFTDGVHCEGSLLATILFILFWDIIYDSNVPGVFIGEIQYLPLDLWSKDFYLNRKKLIDQRLEEITSKWPLSKLEDFVMDMWKNHAHEKSLVNDGLVEGPEQLFEVMLCIGREMLAQILERMVKSFKTYHSGLPDLFLWNFNERTCKFVEVKGEKDKLSTKQKLWLKFLLSINSDAEVCHVHTVGSKYRATFKRKIKNDVKKEEKKSNDLN